MPGLCGRFYCVHVVFGCGMYLFEWVVSSLFLHGMYVVKLQVVKLTQRIVPHLQLPPGSHRVIVAASSHLNKFFFLDCDDGNIYVGTRNLLIDGEMMLCVPTEGSEVGREPQDGMLRWLEGYAQALHTGMFHVRTEGGSGSISLYPETSPLCTAAVTRGVQVCFVSHKRSVQTPESLKVWFREV